MSRRVIDILIALAIIGAVHIAIGSFVGKIRATGGENNRESKPVDASYASVEEEALMIRAAILLEDAAGVPFADIILARDLRDAARVRLGVNPKLDGWEGVSFDYGYDGSGWVAYAEISEQGERWRVMIRERPTETGELVRVDRPGA